MSVYAQLRSKPDSTPHEIEEALDGNLCRCTGYRPIIDAARSLSNNKGAPPAGGCCRGSGGSCPCMEAISESDIKVVVDAVPEEKKSGGGCCGGAKKDGQVHACSEEYVAEKEGVDAAMASRGLSEPIFPPALMRFEPSVLKIAGPTITWHQPLTLDQLLALKAAHPEARLIVGNTEVGIETKFKAMEYSVMVNPSHVKELKVLEVDDNAGGITVGSAVTINALRAFCEHLDAQYKAEEKGYATRGLLAIRDMLTWFASNQIRNVAAVGGNIVTASPISDLNPMLIACNAVLNVRSSARGIRQVAMSKFFLAYRKVDLQPDEILESVFIPFTKQFEFVLPFKQARRREDDISIVTSGIRVRLEPHGTSHWVVADCALAYGGMAPTTVCAVKTAAALVGKQWCFTTFESVFSTLREELSLTDNVPGGQSQYRMALTVSFLFKAFLGVTEQLKAHLTMLKTTQRSILPPAPEVDSVERSGSTNYLSEDKPYTRSQQ
eukprot:gene37266-45984_t